MNRPPVLRLSRSLEVRVRDACSGPFAALPVAILALDPSGSVLGANARFHELANTSGLPTLADLVGATEVDAWKTAIDRAVAGTGNVDFPQTLLRAGMPPLHVKVSLGAVPRGDRGPEHLLAAITDVEEYESLAGDLRRCVEESNEELRARSEFVAVVSHEFKNGLTGMAGFAEMIRNFELDPATTREYAGDILNDAHRMSRMLSEMLELARLESGHMRLQVASADLNSLVELQVRRLAVGGAPVRFLAGHLPAVACDSDRTIQVLANLLSNALKYSPDGGEICVVTRSSGGFAEVAVTDHGLGIPADELVHLFGRFRRVEKGSAGKISGTGLGLAISREIAQRQGGLLTVESTYGEGSTFTFTIPLAASDGQDGSVANDAGEDT